MNDPTLPEPVVVTPPAEPLVPFVSALLILAAERWIDLHGEDDQSLDEFTQKAHLAFWGCRLSKP